ncbi:ABC transporter substrate-binding protein [Falcatimonas sp. MSJ-15]|uniref:ABC transporter substrate-binding protein n=1 Tax=Falcatimonas sp. MSJ-15 TaxID=2841515 RepID=UPI001C114496|nr:ABC transporter substrate-binding protein [Falcatimonas sp. MSJ-15]MBU5470574.1 ABC transporter substrate-binding protein [Falcatimonas sp. MSJ-15]
MKKKLLSVCLATSMAATLFAGCGGNTADNDKNNEPKESKDSQSTKEDKKDDTSKDEEGKVFRIYCWNDEFKGLFDTYFASEVPSDVKVEWVSTPSKDNAYQQKLDQGLLDQDKASDDDKIDMFLIEADYALKYVDSDYTLDVINDIGLTEDELSDQYQYTKDIVTDSDGKLKAVSWQATPGLFAYRRSIAKEVLGTDDPEEVQKQLSDWDKFDEVAKKMSDGGYKMLSGYDDSYRVFSNNVTKPWVDENDNIVIDDNIMKWVDQTKEYTDNGYNNKTSLWATEWSADQGPTGKVFGFFYSTWGINFTLLGNSLETPLPEGLTKTSDPDAYKAATEGNGIYGDWAVCEGPQAYYWGGSWLCAAKGTDNPTLVKQVMEKFTCDKDTMKTITLDTEDYTNSQSAMKELADDPDYGSAFLSGQNHIALFSSAAPKIDMSNCTPYDQGLNEAFQSAFKDYFNGTVTKDEALENFYKAAVVKYPNLKYK